MRPAACRLSRKTRHSWGRFLGWSGKRLLGLPVPGPRLARSVSAEELLDLVDPFAVGVEDPASERVQEAELAAAVGEECLARFFFVEDRFQLGDLGAERVEARDDGAGLGGEVAGVDADRGLTLDAGEGAGLGEPVLERLEPLLGQAVMRPFARLAGRFLGAEVAELLESFRLGVDLALGARPVEALAGARHPDEIVRAGAVSPDQGEDGVGETGQLA